MNKKIIYIISFAVSLIAGFIVTTINNYDYLGIITFFVTVVSGSILLLKNVKQKTMLKFISIVSGGFLCGIILVYKIFSSQ